MMPERLVPVARPVRRRFILALFGVAAVLLLFRAVDLQVRRTGFLQEHGDARAVRIVTVAAHRGMITDRNGEPLAISTPMDSVWMNPREARGAGRSPDPLARALGMAPAELRGLLCGRGSREFVYLRLQGEHRDSDLGGTQNLLTFQAVWAMGPHKHETY